MFTWLQNSSLGRGRETVKLQMGEWKLIKWYYLKNGIEPLHTTTQCTQTHTRTTSNPDPFLCPRTVLLSMAHNCYFLQLPYNNLTMFSAIRKMVLTFLVLILSKFLKLHRTLNNINNLITIFLILGVVRKQHNIILVVNLFIVVWE